MAYSSNGQISYLILDSLSEGSKYGLEIIEFISSKTNGQFVMKKPTLYSCLQRMEKKGYISSSYWGESELGGKRHYYSITNEGRKNLEILSKEFEGVDYSSAENIESEEPKQEQLSLLEDKKEESKEFNIYDAVAQNITSQVEEEEPAEDDTLANQIDIFEFQEKSEDEEISKEFEETYFVEHSPEEEVEEPVQDIEETEESSEESIEESEEIEERLDTEEFEENKSIEETNEEKLTEDTEEEIHDDGRLLEESEGLTPFQEEQNKRLYDTSSELGRYRKRKSFSENQIEMSVVYQQQEDLDAQKQRIAQLKQSMLNVKQSGFDNLNTEVKEEKEEVKEKDFEPTDDAVFISERKIAENDIPIQRKIMPTNIEINVYDADLPAPKRNSALEPTYKDMLARLFEKKHENDKSGEANTTTFTNKKFADYDGLQKYYQTKNITFKEYKKTSVQRKHNTNLLNIISSGILFVLSSICSALLFWITSASNHLKHSTNFMYILIPLLFLGWTIYMFVYFKLYPSKKARQKFNQITNWIIFVLATLVIFVINILCGMQFETIPEYCTSLFLPILAVLIVLPINYYIKKFIYQKYSK